MAKIGELKGALDSLGDRHISIGGDNGEMVRHLKDISTYMDMATDSMGRMEDHLASIGRNTGDSNTALARQTQILRDNADAHRSAADAVTALATAHRNTGGGGGGFAPSGGGGGSSAGGSGGGGHGGMGFYGSGAFVPWRGGGFQAVKFWGMAIAEFAATAVPALMAAGAASVVGMKGAEDVMLRAKAISTTATALGPAYGQTVGSYIGTSGTLGRYQNMARGGVYELAGAGINFANAGSGAFSQMGLSTIAMMDRGVANMLNNYKDRQAAGKGGLGDMMGGGTEWLRRYGDLFSNLGSTVMNLAPYEPGLGGDVLNTLVGGTGFLKQMTQDIPGPLLGGIMAAEGGMRWGKAALGGKGLLGRVLGLRKVGGLGGLLSKGGEGLFQRGMGGALGDLGLGMMGAGDALAGAAGPISLAAALSAYGLSYLASTMPSPAERQVAGLQAGIGQAGFSAAFHPLAHAIVTARGLAASLPTGPGADMMGASQTPGSFMRFGPIGPTARQVYANAATSWEQTQADLINAGPQLVTALKKAGLKTVGMADAFQIAQNALLDTTHAFGKDGKLNKTAQTMLQNYVKGIAPMTQTGGAFNAAIGAQQIMSSPQMKALSQVNQAMDSMQQIASGGPAGMATLFGMLGGSQIPVKKTAAGIQMQAPPAFKAMAKALTSFTSAPGASAWNTFAGSQGLVTAEQQNLDQLRTYMTLGAIGSRGAAGVAGFQLEQLLPLAKKSPAALAMLMQQGAGIGIGGYYQGTGTAADQAKNYAAFSKALGGQAFDSKHLTQAMNQAVINASNIPATAAQFMQGVHGSIQAQQVAQASQDVARLRQAAAGGTVAIGAGRDLASVFKAQGLHGQALTGSIDAALKQAGVSRTMRVNIEAQVNTAQVKAQLAGIKSVAPVNVQVHANGVATASQQIQGIKGHNVMITAAASGVGAAQAAINSVHGKVVDIVVNTIVTGGTVSQSAMRAAGYAPGVSASQIAAGIRKSSMGMQTGGMVPGSGHGDIIPAMLEPGEAIIPRYLVPLIAPILAAHRVPGFGGVPQSSASHFAAGGLAGVPRPPGSRSTGTPGSSSRSPWSTRSRRR